MWSVGHEPMACCWRSILCRSGRRRAPHRRNPGRGLFDRANIASTIFAATICILAGGLMRFAWLLALAKMTVVLFFACFADAVVIGDTEQGDRDELLAYCAWRSAPDQRDQHGPGRCHVGEAPRAVACDRNAMMRGRLRRRRLIDRAQPARACRSVEFRHVPADRTGCRPRLKPPNEQPQRAVGH